MPMIVINILARDFGGRMTVTVLLVALLVLQSQKAFPLDEITSPSGLGSPNTLALRVDFAKGLLSVEAKQELRVKLLNEIRKKTGIHFHYSVPLEGSITLSFAALSVKQALERLFGPDASFVFRYPGMTGRSAPSALPTEVWVLGKASVGGSEAIRTANGKPEGESAASGSSTPADPYQVFETPDGTQGVEEDPYTLIEMAKDEDPQMRIQALAALSDSGKADEDIVWPALDAALTDQDPSVRGYAIQALARRAGIDTPNATAYLWQARHDPDPGVRMMVVDSVAPSNDQGIVLLQEALSDADEGIRSLAAFRLKKGVNASGR
jgi:hypothetical protein